MHHTVCHSSCSCLDVNTREKGKLCGASAEVRPIHAGVRVRSVTTRETGRDTSEEEMLPFPLALGFNNTIPARSRVQLIAHIAPCRALSRVGPPVQAFLSRVVTQVSRRAEERTIACKIRDLGPLKYKFNKYENIEI